MHDDPPARVPACAMHADRSGTAKRDLAANSNYSVAASSHSQRYLTSVQCVLEIIFVLVISQARLTSTTQTVFFSIFLLGYLFIKAGFPL